MRELVEAGRRARRPIVLLEEFHPSQEALELLTPRVIREHKVLPLALSQERILLACLESEAIKVDDFFSRYLGREVVPVLADPSDLERAVTRFCGETSQELTDLASAAIGRHRQSVQTKSREVSTPVARLVHHTIEQAVKLRASDIHLEPSEEDSRLKFRIDGCLVEQNSVPKRIYDAFVSRIKILAELDIAERRRPQDGRATVTIGKRKVDLRVSVMPALAGEAVVLRLLGVQEKVREIKDLSFPPSLESRWLKAARSPHGIVLVTGPTGSGKTSTLYATLRAIQRPEAKILTLEEPVEARLPGVLQIPIRDDLGFTFEKGLRSALRHDPDIMLVGEIRDRESAKIAISASLTGHLLFATLHTNTAPQAVTRLVHMGIPDYQLMTALQGVLAQRLMRRLCEHCKAPAASSRPAPSLFESVETTGLREPRGCDQCNGIGYSGRFPVVEFLPITNKMRGLQGTELTPMAVQKLAIEDGYRPMAEVAKERVLSGETSLCEYYELFGEEI